ncbi:hypothetical protein QBC45DRAFT_421265 [Copromyces sp. CBS 386.78]|nr:hypothetical protein QBC45DRAFT_421265 [Copromyces sp. CBS 386.78]
MPAAVVQVQISSTLKASLVIRVVIYRLSFPRIVSSRPRIAQTTLHCLWNGTPSAAMLDSSLLQSICEYLSNLASLQVMDRRNLKFMDLVALLSCTFILIPRPGQTGTATSGTGIQLPGVHRAIVDNLKTWGTYDPAVWRASASNEEDSRLVPLGLASVVNPSLPQDMLSVDDSEMPIGRITVAMKAMKSLKKTQRTWARLRACRPQIGDRARVVDEEQGHSPEWNPVSGRGPRCGLAVDCISWLHQPRKIANSCHCPPPGVR